MLGVRFSYAAMTSMRYETGGASHMNSSFWTGKETAEFETTERLKEKLIAQIKEKYASFSDRTEAEVFDIQIKLDNKWVNYGDYFKD